MIYLFPTVTSNPPPHLIPSHPFLPENTCLELLDPKRLPAPVVTPLDP